VTDEDVVIEDDEPEQTDNSVRPEDGDQAEAQAFADAYLAGTPREEGND
jgi:hypothetical protein